MVIAAFALTLIAEGLVLGFARRAGWVAVAIGFTAVVAAANLAFALYMVWAGYGLQWFSTLAVVLGVYACVVLSQRYRELRAWAAVGA